MKRKRRKHTSELKTRVSFVAIQELSQTLVFPTILGRFKMKKIRVSEEQIIGIVKEGEPSFEMVDWIGVFRKRDFSSDLSLVG